MVRILIRWSPRLSKPFIVNNTRLSLRVHFWKYLSIALLVACQWSAWGQQRGGMGQDRDAGQQRSRSRIIDDSTKQVYGPRTSQYFYEEDYFFNNFRRQPVDTVIRNFHQFNFVQRHQNLYQDLGNIGTAIRPVYTYAPEAIGAVSGFDAYDLYWKEERIRHYDTKSPYSNMNVVLGGKGRSMTRVAYSRNINPRWNFGFNYRGLFIDKQVQRGGKGDRHVRGNYYDLYTSYKSKDSTYSIFFTYQHSFQESDEYGGILLEDLFTFSDLFLVNAQPWLTKAESNDRRSNVHLFQQYRLGSALQAYHKLDLYRQTNQFNDNYEVEPEDFFDNIVVDSAKSRDEVSFRTIRNEVGIKGNLLKLFYNGYVAVRSYKMNYRYLYEDYFPLKTQGDEVYVGGRMILQLDSLLSVRGWVEYLLPGNYRIEGAVETKWFDVGVRRTLSKPTYLQLAYRGSHDFWVNAWDDVESSELFGNIHYRSRWLSVSPGVRLATFKNYIFFKEDNFDSDQTVLPVQTDGYQTYTAPQLAISMTPLRHVNISAKGIYTRMLENDGDALQMPEWFVNAQLSYANIWFNGNFDFQIGVDVHAKSEYYAYGYDPVIQQFYMQQNFKVPLAPVIDVFLNAKIKRGRIFLKYNNLFKTFNDFAAIPTPGYPGIRNLVDFGFDWSFYD
jgi:hypothetical protein